MTAGSSSTGRSPSSSRAAVTSRASIAPSSEARPSVPPRRDPLLVLGIVGQYPMAGVAWQAIHYLLGLRRLGWDVYYVEDSGAAPYDPRHGGRTDDPAYSVGYVADVMRRFGFEDRWVYLDMANNETYGLQRGRIVVLSRRTSRLLNILRATQTRSDIP